MLYLFNTTIMPNEGDYSNRKISLEKAHKIFFEKGMDCQDEDEDYEDQDMCTPTYTSAIGHQGSADAFNAAFELVTEQEVRVNRIQSTMQPGDEAIALKVLGRLPEGQILTIQELEAVGYEFYHIVRTG